MKKIISLTFLSFLLVIAFSSCAENEFEVFSTIHGVVTDAETGESIPGATITLSPSGKTQTSGYDGRYEFTKVDAKHYTLSAQKPGYTTDRKYVDVVSGEDTEANLTIKKL